MGCPENPVLFPNICPTFTAAGHGFTDNPEAADVFLIDLHSRLFDYDQTLIDYVVSSGKPVVTFDEWDRGNMSKDIWPWPLTEQQQQLFNNNTVPHIHFCRLLDKTQTYPPLLFPLEKPYSYEEPLLTADELFNRPYDVVWIANDSPTRQKIKTAIESDKRIKSKIILGEPQIPFNDWVAAHREGKFFISAGAGGYTDQKKQALFSVAAIIQERTDQLLLHPFSHSMNCLKVNQPPTQLDLQTIADVCNDKQRLFEIYRNGYNFVKEFYSAEYIANDILSKIKKHGLI